MGLRKIYTLSAVKQIPNDKCLEVSLTENKSEMMVIRRIHESEVNFTLFKNLHKGDILSCIVDAKIRSVERVR